MSYKEPGTAAAKDLIETPELPEMIEQSNLFMFDKKGRLSTQKNHTLLSVLKGLQDDLPSIGQLELFVKKNRRPLADGDLQEPKEQDPVQTVVEEQCEVGENVAWYNEEKCQETEYEGIQAPHQKGVGFEKNAHEEETRYHRIGGQSEGSGQAGIGTKGIGCIW